MFLQCVIVSITCSLFFLFKFSLFVKSVVRLGSSCYRFTYLTFLLWSFLHAFSAFIGIFLSLQYSCVLTRVCDSWLVDLLQVPTPPRQVHFTCFTIFHFPLGFLICIVFLHVSILSAFVHRPVVGWVATSSHSSNTFSLVWVLDMSSRFSHQVTSAFILFVCVLIECVCSGSGWVVPSTRRLVSWCFLSSSVSFFNYFPLVSVRVVFRVGLRCYVQSLIHAIWSLRVSSRHQSHFTFYQFVSVRLVSVP